MQAGFCNMTFAIFCYFTLSLVACVFMKIWKIYKSKAFFSILPYLPFLPLKKGKNALASTMKIYMIVSMCNKMRGN